MGYKARGDFVRAKYGELVADYLKQLPSSTEPSSSSSLDHDKSASNSCQVPAEGLAKLPSEAVLREIGVGDTVEIRQLEGFGEYNRGLFSRRRIAAGEVVMVGRRTAVVPCRAVYSVQVSLRPEMHIELDAVTQLANHSCDPNTAPRSNELGSYTWIALRPIGAGEEITWDYECTEYEIMSNALCKCLCGTPE